MLTNDKTDNIIALDYPNWITKKGGNMTQTHGTATMHLMNFIREKGIKGSAISTATGITAGVLYPAMQGRRELRADEFLAICKFTGADPKEMYREE